MPEVYTYAQAENGIRKRVIVDLDDIPIDLAARNQAVQRLLTAGDYRDAPPSLAESTGELLQGAGRLGVEMAPSMAAIGAGESRGAAAGAPMGPWGAVVGGLAGGALGGVLGRAGSNVLLQREESPLETIRYGGEAGLISELIGVPLRAIPTVKPGIVPRYTQQAEARAAAQARGIDLDAAQLSGSNMLRSVRAFATRAGSKKLEAFGERQAAQVVAAGEIQAQAFGPPQDIATRSNRFLGLLETRMDALHQQGDDLFARAYQQMGLNTPASLQPLYDAAFTIRNNQPVLESLRNPKLIKLLENIEALQSQGFMELPLKRVRDIQTALGDIAFPKALAGSVTVDAPVAAATQLWGALRDGVTSVATQRGAIPAWEEALQHHALVIARANNSQTMKALLAGEKQLPSLAKQVFNPNDPGLLIDAKAILSPDGWKLLQQQYWDEAWTVGTMTTPSGLQGFNGKRFADKIQKDRPMLKHLLTPEQLEGVEAFAKAARLVGDTTALQPAEAFGAMFTMGRLGAAFGGAVALASGQTAAGATALAVTTTPWAFGKLLTNPTTAKMLAAAFRDGRIRDTKTIKTLLRWAGRAGAIKLVGSPVETVGPEAQAIAR